MKKIATLVILLLSLTSFPLAATAEEGQDDTLTKLQEYCAKEQDPIKRLHYCSALEQYNEAQIPQEEYYNQSVVV